MSKNLAVVNKQSYLPKKVVGEMINQAFGKPMPHDAKMEADVIATALIGGTDETGTKINMRFRSVSFLEPKDFYLDIHRDYWAIFTEMDAKRIPINTITVTRELMKKGSPTSAFDVVTMSQNVGDHGDFVTHARILFELSMMREAVHKSYEFIKQIFTQKSDIFDTRNNFAQELRIVAPTAFFKAQSMNAAMEVGKNAAPMLQFAGHILRSGEITFLFAEPGIGKSILAVQLADNISRGRGSLGAKDSDAMPFDVLKNEAGRKKVLYYDFELLERELFERYSTDDQMYEFDEEMLIRLSENDEHWSDKKKVDIVSIVEDNIDALDPECVIIDNLTWLTAEGSHDTDVALTLMKTLKRINKRTGLPFLILAHSTKKINKTAPITQGDMSGSAHLLRFATNIVAIGRSNVDNDLRYIKQVKQRNGSEVYHEENVIVCQIQKEDKMLRFKFLTFDAERNHLADFNSTDGQEEIIENAIILRVEQGYGWMKVASKIGWKGSKNTLEKKCKDFANRSMQYELAPDGKIVQLKTAYTKPTESNPNPNQDLIDRRGKMNDEDIPL